MNVKITKEEYAQLKPFQQARCVADGDSYMMELEDKDLRTELGEFRKNNIEYRQTIEGLQADLKKFADVDPEKYKDTLQKLQEMEDKHLIDEGKMEELFDVRTERMRNETAGQIEALTTDRDKYKTRSESSDSRLSKLLIDSSVTSVVTEVGTVRQGAMTDILSRAHGTFSLNEDGNITPMKDGKVLYGKEGKEPLSAKEFCEDLLESAPYLFENSGGGGAAGSGGAGGDGKVKTIDRNDQQGFSANLDAIAGGKVQVG